MAHMMKEHLEVVKTLTSEVNKKLIVQTSELIVLRKKLSFDN